MGADEDESWRDCVCWLGSGSHHHRHTRLDRKEEKEINVFCIIGYILSYQLPPVREDRRFFVAEMLKMKSEIKNLVCNIAYNE